ncbi:MAG: Maf family protein [Vicinamibacterales bacterium]
MRIILASASPRRAELLASAGFAFDVDPAHVDETRRGNEAPAAYAQRIARDKAAAVAARHPGRIVLAADTIVVQDGSVYGKPADRAHAARMLRALSGREHEVLTAVAVARGDRIHEHVESTRVTFASMTAAEMDWYVASGEADDKAGAYAIQGLAARFIPRIDGSYSNVVGLPIAAVHRMLAQTLTR